MQFNAIDSDKICCCRSIVDGLKIIIIWIKCDSSPVLFHEFTITFQNAIDASSVDINDFAINGIVYTGTTSVSGAVVTLSTSGIFATDEVNTVSIVGEVLDLLGNAANIGHSSSTTSMENMQIMASRMSKDTITLNFTNALSLSSDNTNVSAFLVTGATVVSWSITDTVITITTSGLTGTDETPVVAYDPSYSTNLETSAGIFNEHISIKTVDKIQEYIVRSHQTLI